MGQAIGLNQLISGPMRVLALGGHGSCNDVTECQALVLGLEERHHLQLGYLNGPFATDKAYCPSLRGHPGPFFNWTENPEERHTRTGLAQAVKHVIDYAAQNGPFDGIYGFSNGALVAALATEALEVALAEASPDRHPADPLPHLSGVVPWKFVVAACASCLDEDLPNASAASENKQAKRQSPKLSTQSLHLVGMKDPIRCRSLALQEMFESPRVYEMDASHSVPITLTEDEHLHAALSQFFDNVKR